MVPGFYASSLQVAEIACPDKGNNSKQVLHSISSKLLKILHLLSLVIPPVDSHSEVLQVRRLLPLEADLMRMLQLQLQLIQLLQESRLEGAQKLQLGISQ